MPSPFPGMDPYLEGHLWPDVHHRLATDYRWITASLRPRLICLPRMRSGWRTCLIFGTHPGVALN
jgi:hypothetical protein